MKTTLSATRKELKDGRIRITKNHVELYDGNAYFGRNIILQKGPLDMIDTNKSDLSAMNLAVAKRIRKMNAKLA